MRLQTDSLPSIRPVEHTGVPAGKLDEVSFAGCNCITYLGKYHNIPSYYRRYRGSCAKGIC